MAVRNILARHGYEEPRSLAMSLRAENLPHVLHLYVWDGGERLGPKRYMVEVSFNGGTMERVTIGGSIEAALRQFPWEAYGGRP